MALAERLISWLMITVLTLVWTVPVSIAPAWAQAAPGAEFGRRIALVVGNSAYTSAEVLRNAVNDSRAIADSLAELGFEVFEAEDVDHDRFVESIAAFEKEAATADAAVFYFSGHGFQLGGANYLVPTDARLTNRDAIEAETLRLDDVIGRIQAHNRQTLIFIDACRNNPLPASVRGKDAADGLAQIEAGSGAFVAFATQPGNVSRDGAGDHSPFTGALLDHLSTPGISISDMMIRVRNSVEEETKNTQTPWDQSSLRSQFYFNPEEEADEALTEEDRELLLSLDPALRAKFEQRFGIKIKDASEEDPEEPAMVASIQPRLLITDADGAQPELEDAPQLSADAAPTDQTRETTTMVVEPTPGAPVIGALRILSDDVAPEEERPVDMAALDPTEQAPVAAEPGTVLDVFGQIPTPTFRPEDQPAAEVAVEVAKLDENAAAEPLALDDQAPSESAAEAAQALPSDGRGPDGKYVGTFVPAPVASVTERARPAGTVEMAALDAASARLSDASSSPVDGNADRIEGQEVFAPGTLAPQDLATPPTIATREPVTTLSAASPSGGSATVSAPDVAIAVATPETPALAPAAPETASAPAPATLAASVDQQTAVAATLQEIRPAPTVPGAPVLIPVPEVPVASSPAAPVAPAAPEPEIELAAVSPEDVRPPPIERAEPEESEVEAEAVPAPTKEEQRETARQIQAELTRLGCYRSGIDGIWGANSARGLLRYFATKKESPDTLDPDATLLTRLQTEDEVVCKRTETQPTATNPVKKRTVKTPPRENRPVAVRTQRPSAPAARATQPQRKTVSGDAPKRKLSRNLKLGGLR